MRGMLRKKLLKSGKYSLYIDYYPPVWNPHKQIYTRGEFLKLYIQINPATSLKQQENLLHQEIAEKIFIKRMKALMLDANGLFNKDVQEADFLPMHWRLYTKSKKRTRKRRCLVSTQSRVSCPIPAGV